MTKPNKIQLACGVENEKEVLQALVMVQGHPRRDFLHRSSCLLMGAGLAALCLPAMAQTTRAGRAPDWAAAQAVARGQTVYFNAWAGSEQINAYIQWVAKEVQREFGVKLEHVKISDAADVVKRVRTEKAAGRGADSGTVDLMWINGENFATMKREGLLHRFADTLPNFAYVDILGKPTTLSDFSIATDGLESPWGMAQLTFMADGRRLRKLPQNMRELLSLAKVNPGRITYPRLPDFHGTTFVKQALLESMVDKKALMLPPASAQDFSQHTAPLWSFLDALHPHLWRGGRQFAQNAASVRQMMGDGELLMALTFNPNEAANEIAAQRMAATVVSWQFAKGTIGNTHFVAIPFNSKAKAGAQLVANFLLSPQAQARKADITVWGDPTVLNIQRLPVKQKALFAAKSLPGQVVKVAPTLQEPHAGWVEPLEKEWTRRYGRA